MTEGIKQIFGDMSEYPTTRLDVVYNWWSEVHYNKLLASFTSLEKSETREVKYV